LLTSSFKFQGQFGKGLNLKVSNPMRSTTIFSIQMPIILYQHEQLGTNSWLCIIRQMRCCFGVDMHGGALDQYPIKQVG
jgi:hypothetical protein